MTGAAPTPVRLVVSDIDGTLVTPDKALTPAAFGAVRALNKAGVGFTVVSSRPARGMRSVVDQLQVTLPFAAFNGGSVVAPDGRLLSAKRLSPDAARGAIGLFQARGVEVWGFADDQWLVLALEGPHVEHERHTVGFGPTLVADFERVIDRLDKLVAVSDDAPLLADVERQAQAALEGLANARRSQTYYLDVTNPEADKGHAVRALCAAIGVELAETAVIGDQVNDIAMFRVAGLSIAMGQGTDEVKASADLATDANTADGFAHAIERFVLPRAGQTGG
jgi:Cof subfamily protein (haloacid dehalogenase superfamily)